MSPREADILLAPWLFIPETWTGFDRSVTGCIFSIYKEQLIVFIHLQLHAVCMTFLHQLFLNKVSAGVRLPVNELLPWKPPTPHPRFLTVYLLYSWCPGFGLGGITGIFVHGFGFSLLECCDCRVELRWTLSLRDPGERPGAGLGAGGRWGSTLPPPGLIDIKIRKKRYLFTQHEWNPSIHPMKHIQERAQ